MCTVEYAAFDFELRVRSRVDTYNENVTVGFPYIDIIITYKRT